MLSLMSQWEIGRMKYFCLCSIMLAHFALAVEWATYDAFVVDATNAMANVAVLMSDEYTNRLIICRNELNPTNEIASAALLMLAISDDAKSTHVDSQVGDTNFLKRVSWFLTSPATDRTMWQKSCAIAMLASANDNPAAAVGYFNCATNALHIWDSMSSCFNGGELYRRIAQNFGVPELDARSNLIFAAADSAKTAGMTSLFNYFVSLLPAETREFLRRREEF